MSLTSPSYIASVINAESGGNPFASNPLSSARGLGGFMPKTWQALMQKHPELGLTADGMSDPDQVKLAVNALAQDDGPMLSKVLGRQPTGSELYGAYTLGAPSAQAVYSSSDDTPLLVAIAEAKGPEFAQTVGQQNPQYTKMTVGDFKKFTEGKVPPQTASSVASAVPQLPPPITVPPRTPDAQAQPIQDQAPPVPNAQPDPTTAPKDGNTPSFMDRFLTAPGAGRSLMAFGAGLLSGQGFGDGLAKGLAAVNEQLNTQQEMELRKQQLLGQIRVSKGGMFYGPDGTIYRETVNNRGQITYVNANTGQEVPNLPKDTVRVEDSGYRTREVAEQKLVTQARDDALAAQPNIQRYDRMMKLVDTSGAGPGLGQQVVRTLAQLSGRDIGDVNLSDMQEFSKLSNDLQLSLAQGQKGLGQLTEGERAIIKDALPSLNTDKTAMKRIITVLRAAEQRKADLYESWKDLPPSVKAQHGGFESYAYDYLKNWEQNVAPKIYDGFSTPITTQKTTTSGGSSVLDDADAIVGIGK